MNKELEEMIKTIVILSTINTLKILQTSIQSTLELTKDKNMSSETKLSIIAQCLSKWVEQSTKELEEMKHE